MMRVLLLSSLLLLALQASAQPNPLDGAATLTFAGVPSARVVANGTQHAQPLDFTLQVGQGTCTGGSQDITVTLAADGPGATVTVEPRTFTYTIGPADTVGGGTSFSGRAVVVVDAGVVAHETEIPVNVTATSSDAACSVAVFGSVPTAETSGSYVVEFYPLSGVNSTTTTEEPVPGLELPVVLLAVVAGVLLLRRRKA